MKDRILILENGKTFVGDGFGSDKTTIAEVVFNTSMVGYQEILSDPTNIGQIVIMSYPLIGNYGMTDDDYESKNVYTSGLIVKEYNDSPSNFRFTKTLGEVMNDYNVSGLSNLDTRELIKTIRDEGSMLGMITNVDANVLECVTIMKNAKRSANLVGEVSTKKIWYSRTRNPQYNVVALDFGIKLSFVKQLNNAGCNVVIVPYDTTYETIMQLYPDGIFLSNGAGSPNDLKCVTELVNKLKGQLPILGVALGCGIIGVAYGAKIKKLKVGHRGTNHPVKNLENGKIFNYTQNHAYTIDEKSLKNTELEISYLNVLDNEVEGVSDDSNMVMGVQFYPEVANDDHDFDSVFARFTEFMNLNGGEQNAKENRY
ncbi:MAG: glutamine-hydrolyzing carbamoyl-phosphate synthase small subunit [Clostridia bacterium]